MIRSFSSPLLKGSRRILEGSHIGIYDTRRDVVMIKGLV